MATAADEPPMETPPVEGALLERTARSVAAAGATLTGARRRELAERSRSQRARATALPLDGGGPTVDGDQSGDDPLTRFVDRLTLAPATLRRRDVDDLDRAGVGAPTYVEVLGLVARLNAVDTFRFGLGAPPVELPPAAPGRPDGRVAREARLDRGWVPTVGRASPPTALSLVPQELAAMEDAHGVLYLSIPDMADLDADRGLHRTQMELVAARTSLLNECFF